MRDLIPVSEIQTLAKSFAESGLFSDAKDMAKAFVKIQAGQEIGLPPFASMSGIHIIQGKPVMGAGLIASSIKANPKYNYKVVKLSDVICSIDFYEGSEVIGNSSFTIDDAKKAGTKNIDKFPKNMLFARAISNGVKWYCPDVFAGPVYVPEEFQEQTIDTTAEDVTESKDTVLDDALKRVEECPTLEGLKSIYGMFPELHRANDFLTALTNRKKVLSNE